jgi:hypothetical protein
VKFKKNFTWPKDPPYGIIYNQKPEDSPYTTTSDVNGVYEISLGKNESKIFNDSGVPYKKAL